MAGGQVARQSPFRYLRCSSSHQVVHLEPIHLQPTASCHSRGRSQLTPHPEVVGPTLVHVLVLSIV